MTGTDQNWQSAIYEGRLTHRRLRPRAHQFAYRVFSLLIDLDELPALDQRLKRFSRGRLNLVSFHDRDFTTDRPTDLAAHIRATLQAAAMEGSEIDGSGPIRLLCYPRIAGYAFNPLSVYYCHDAHEKPSAIIYEVSSTFGERHSYLFPIRDHGVIRQSTDKKLHVSPFMPMDQHYHFRTRVPDEAATLIIRQTDADGVIFTAAFQGARTPLTDKTLIAALRRHPLMAVKVIGAIHLEAARLMMKGLRLRAGPPQPARSVTVIGPTFSRSSYARASPLDQSVDRSADRSADRSGDPYTVQPVSEKPGRAQT